MFWNVRGINASWKWNAVRDKIVQSACDIACLQETKKEAFDRQFLNNFCPSNLDVFDCLPSMGASGGHSCCLEKCSLFWAKNLQ